MGVLGATARACVKNNCAAGSGFQGSQIQVTRPELYRWYLNSGAHQGTRGWLSPPSVFHTGFRIHIARLSLNQDLVNGGSRLRLKVVIQF